MALKLLVLLVDETMSHRQHIVQRDFDSLLKITAKSTRKHSMKWKGCKEFLSPMVSYS